MDKCHGILGKLFGHSFKPVIAKSAVKFPTRIEGTPSFVSRTLDAHREIPDVELMFRMTDMKSRQSHIPTSAINR